MAADAEWGIRYVKVDSCGGNGSMTNQGVWDQHATWRAALNATGRQMWLSICPQYVYEDAFPDMHCVPGFAFNSRGWVAMGLDPTGLANGILTECECGSFC